MYTAVTDIAAGMVPFLVAIRGELLLFFAAMIAHFALFGNVFRKKGKHDAHVKAKMVDLPGRGRNPSAQPQFQFDDADVAATLQNALDSGDHRAVLRCWNIMKRSDNFPSVPLTKVVESMQRFKKEPSFIVRELRVFFSKNPSDGDTERMDIVNDLLESLSKRLDTELMEMILEMLPSLRLDSDQRTYEILLNTHFTTRNFPKVRSIASEMKAKQMPFTTRSTMVMLKTALKMNNFEEASRCFRELKGDWSDVSAGASASTAPRHIVRHIVSQLVELACKERLLAEFLPELEGVSINEEVINVMLTECVRQKNASLAMQVEQLAKAQGVSLSDTSYGLLVKGYAGDPVRVEQFIHDVLSLNKERSSEFVLAVLSFSSQTGNVDVVDKLYANTKTNVFPVISAFIRFYADNEQHSKACEIFERDLLAVHAVNIGESNQRSLFLDARLERALMNSALRCGRDDVAKKLLEYSPSDATKHITMIRKYAEEGNQSAMKVFESLKESGVDLSSVMYNTVLDACVESRDLRAAENWMEQTKQAGMADVVSFNTLIKAHLKNDNFDKARSIMEEMRLKNLQPNRVTFHELLNAMTMQGGPSRRTQIWDVLAEMRSAGVKPNQVTCSILMKKLNAQSDPNDIKQTMELINMTEEPMDEVLLSSIVEACVRIGKPDLLASKLQQIKKTGDMSAIGPHTFGSLIKAYGRAKDMDGVWRCWKEMRSRHIEPTSITLGCMVEAVAGNGDTEGAYELIHQMQEDKLCREALNSVIYGSVLKGFARDKKMDRVWTVYEEMIKRNIQFSTVTYNTLIDACARCGRMEHVPKLLDDMQHRQIKPNLITYSTMLKGHCQMGNIQIGFKILAEMKTEARLKPDEIMYKSLLDGCAQYNLVDEGLQLFDEMQKEGIAISNFTLSILVKLMSRGRKLDGAFNMVKDVTRKYNFKANIHVYTNLIHACVSNRQLARAIGVLETMMKERVQPESRTYAILIRSSLSHRHFAEVVGLLRGALGLQGASPAFLAENPKLAVCPNLDFALVNEALVALADAGRSQELASRLLTDIKEGKPEVRIELATQRKVASLGAVQTVQGSSEAHPWAANGSGPRRKRP